MITKTNENPVSSTSGRGDGKPIRLHQDLAKGPEPRLRDETTALREKLYKRVVRAPERIEDLVAGLDHELPVVKYGCSAVLRMLSDRKPELLADRWAFFTKQLHHEQPFRRWDAIEIVGNLAGAVDKRRVDTVLSKQLEPIAGPDLVAAVNWIASAARAAERQPKATPKAVDGLLLVGRAKFDDADQKNVAIGHAITALASIYHQLDDASRVLRFVRRHRENPRRDVQLKAEKFLELHAARRAR
ncbi:MAG: hypothetical protein AAF488_04410 [Planctomycetota bacterium]